MRLFRLVKELIDARWPDPAIAHAQALEADYQAFRQRTLERVKREFDELARRQSQIVIKDQYAIQRRVYTKGRRLNRNVSLTTYKTKPLFGWHTYSVRDDRYFTRQYGEW
jgi:hypothetical protein